jgi:hypothetical protein
MSRPKTDFEALRQDLHQVYEGHPWHGSSITSVLDGISAESAKSRPIPDAHNIWELVLHMAVWTREVASRVRGADAKNPPEDWPVPRFGGGEEAWKSAKKDLAAAQKELEQAVDAIQPDELWYGNERRNRHSRPTAAPHLPSGSDRATQARDPKWPPATQGLGETIRYQVPGYR